MTEFKPGEKAPPAGWEEDLKALQRENAKLKERIRLLEAEVLVAWDTKDSEVEDLRAKAREVVEDILNAASRVNPGDGLTSWRTHLGLKGAAEAVSRKFKLSGP